MQEGGHTPLHRFLHIGAVAMHRLAQARHHGLEHGIGPFDIGIDTGIARALRLLRHATPSLVRTIGR